MNTVTTFLLNIVKLAIAFLLAFFPLHQTEAQDASEAKAKTLRIKMLKEVDGEIQVIDTTVLATDHAELLKSIKGLKADTAMIRRFSSGLPAVINFDTTVNMADMKTMIFNADRLKIDSAVFQSLHGDKVSIIKLNGEVSGIDGKALLERVGKLRQDTIFVRSIKGNKAVYLRADSVNKFHRFDSLKEGDVVKFRSEHPNALYESRIDSAGNVFRLRSGSEVLSDIDPSHIRSIVVQKGHNAISIDSLISSGETRIQFNVKQDEKTGEKKVYRVDKNGKEELVKGQYLKLDHGSAKVVIFMNATVEDITADDKEALKEAGATVETRKKEALGVEAISFYPNPNNGRFNLNFKLEDKGTTRVSVMDSRGEEVFVDTVENLSGEYNRQIDLTPFGRGLFYLQIAQGKKYHTKKILVQ
ncbi:T9SS type A sorting domain-containing protein [Pontibacter toksunensis]|uniref:T9SS type A sorting domain-containing protein n=1 Tax=Pontibacter toksunensis TaxID=1332631 RepID=A0ABW6BUT0_9BACT